MDSTMHHAYKTYCYKAIPVKGSIFESTAWIGVGKIIVNALRSRIIPLVRPIFGRKNCVLKTPDALYS